MVFQSYALFSHLSVADNIVLGLRIRKASKQELSERFSRILTLLGLEKLRDRKPSQLLGEQQQRVALARALVAESKIWLMNEPLLSVLGRPRRSLAAFSTRPYSSRRFCLRSSCSERSLPTRSCAMYFAAKNVLFALVLVQLIIMPDILLVEHYKTMRKLGLIDTLFGIGLPYFASAFAIFLLRQTIKGIPRELVPATMEGASTMLILWRVYVPLAKPVCVAFALLSVSYRWNNFL